MDTEQYYPWQVFPGVNSLTSGCIAMWCSNKQVSTIPKY